MANNSDNEVGNTIALFMIFGIFIAIGFGIIIVGFAAFLTLIAICAQFKTVHFAGEIITAKEGRAFLRNGAIGALLALMIVPQVATEMGYRPTEDWFPFLLLGGYSLGSIGITLMMEAFWGAEPAKEEMILPASRKPEILPPAPKKTPVFAEWDDEDKAKG